MGLLIGLDIGTGSIKAVVYDPERGKVHNLATLNTPVILSGNHYSEYSPKVLWQTVCEVLEQAIEDIPPEEISALGISSFGDTGLVVDANGDPRSPIVTWYDRRCTEQVQWLSERITTEEYFKITGMYPSTALGICKWLWIRDNLPASTQGAWRLLSTPDYILWKLTGEMVTDHSIASRMGMFDPAGRTWSELVLDRAHLSADNLPRLLPSGSIVGSVGNGAATETGLPPGLPCVLGGHDDLCAAITAGVDDPNALVDVCGTSESLLVSRDRFDPSDHLRTYGYQTYTHVIPGRFVIRGGLRSSGGAIRWLAGLVSDEPKEGDRIPYPALCGEARVRIGRAGPIWLPHMDGSGTPHGNASSLASIIGINDEQNRGDLFRGLLESLAFWMRENVDLLEEITGTRFNPVTIMGGASRLDLFNELKATVLNMPLVVSSVPASSAVGAALLAGLGTGRFSNLTEACKTLDYRTEPVLPIKGHVQWYEDLYQKVYRRLYSDLDPIRKNISGLLPGQGIDPRK